MEPVRAKTPTKQEKAECRPNADVPAHPGPVARCRCGGATEGELVDGVCELIEHLRSQAEAIVSLVDRLERIAAHRRTDQILVHRAVQLAAGQFADSPNGVNQSCGRR